MEMMITLSQWVELVFVPGIEEALGICWCALPTTISSSRDQLIPRGKAWSDAQEGGGCSKQRNHYPVRQRDMAPSQGQV